MSRRDKAKEYEAKKKLAEVLEELDDALCARLLRQFLYQGWYRPNGQLRRVQ